LDYVGYKILPFQQLAKVAKNNFNVTTNILDLFGFGESYSKDDIILNYMPMANMIVSLAAEKQVLQNVKFKPYIIGIAGSVAVGKSTTARIIKYLLENNTRYSYKVALVPTDGFLHSNKYLAHHNIEGRKGFPESYDMKKLLNFLAELKQGMCDLQVPCYSHHTYDTVTNEYVTISQADIVIIEGLNVLQSQQDKCNGNKVTVSSFIDFGIYVDANTEDISSWFIKRFMMYRDIAKNDPSAYFYNFRDFSDKHAILYAKAVWKKINLINLNENILPSRNKADLIVAKDSSHCITNVYFKE
jgi:type I pantothenate kinase